MHNASAPLSPSAAGLVPLLVRLLYPKMRKRSGRLGGKGAPGSARAAILNYLAALDSVELAPLVQLFLQPISSAFKQQQEQEQEQHVPPSDRASALRLASPAFLHHNPSHAALAVCAEQSVTANLVKHCLGRRQHACYFPIIMSFGSYQTQLRKGMYRCSYG